MASASSHPSPPPPPPPPLLRSPVFTPIPENVHEDEDEDDASDSDSTPKPHNPTVLHPFSTPPPKNHLGSTTAAAAIDDDDRTVSCNKCRPSSRDKISVVPLDFGGHNPISTPNRLLRSLFPSLTRRTPAPPPPASTPDDWRLAAVELSRKLAHATRRRDEALLESSRLKSALSDLSRKLDRLESRCHYLQSALDRCSPSQSPNLTQIGALPVDPFLRAVSESRSAVRFLVRSLSVHLRPTAKSLDRLASLAPPSHLNRPKSLLSLESLLNRVFYADFESGFALGSNPEPLDPFARCEANRRDYEAVRRLVWEEVLSRGTKHYNEGLSRFCDRRMGEVVGMLGWGGAQRAWPEGLLQAFFNAAKGVWSVHLLARSVHPPVPILRVGAGAKFEPDFMEDVAGSGRGAEAAHVRMVVAPGFYVYSTSCGVVKCKVFCLRNDRDSDHQNNKKNDRNRSILTRNTTGDSSKLHTAV